MGDDLVAAKKAGQNGDALPERTPLIGGVIADETLWSCTTCRWCVEACPVMIEHVPKIVEMRRNLVLEESRFPQEVIPRLQQPGEERAIPGRSAAITRGDWAKELGVKTMAEVAKNGERIEVLYFVGCMGSFDQRNKKVAAAVSKALQAAGVSLRHPGQRRGVQRRPGAAHRQRVPVSDAGAGECRDAERLWRQEGADGVRALLQHYQERVSAVRRRLRGGPPHAVPDRTGGERAASSSTATRPRSWVKTRPTVK